MESLWNPLWNPLWIPCRVFSGILMETLYGILMEPFIED